MSAMFTHLHPPGIREHLIHWLTATSPNSVVAHHCTICACTHLYDAVLIESIANTTLTQLSEYSVCQSRDISLFYVSTPHTTIINHLLNLVRHSVALN